MLGASTRSMRRSSVGGPADGVGTELVATIAHELRTPLAAVRGAAMTLLREDLELDQETRRGLLAVIADASEQLTAVVDEILAAAQLDSGSLAVARERVEAAGIARRVVEAARAHAPEHVRIELVAPPLLPAVAADPGRLRQVLGNLVANAVKYSPDGGLVEVRLEPVGRRMHLSVRDEGLGIPPHEHERIFERFTRLDPPRTGDAGGIGLGLAIARELVRRMGGRIWLESAPGEGSTFFVDLPLA